MTTGSPIYLDHHATTPVDEDVLASMLPYLREHFGNPSSTHSHGRFAADAVEAAREEVALLIGGRARELTFTSGATESNHLAILGACRWRRQRDGRNHVIVLSTAHKAALAPAKQLQSEGFIVTMLPVDGDGHAKLDALKESCSDATALVSVMHANNETGAFCDLQAISSITRKAGAWLHCDAAQGLGYSPLLVRELEIDLVSFTAHKIYGPKGVGALWVRRDGPKVELLPLASGGGQESGRRAGTHNVTGIVGFAAACSKLRRAGEEETRRLRSLSHLMWSELEGQCRGLSLIGPPIGEQRHPGNLLLAFEGLDSAGLLLRVDSTLSLSAGSACSSRGGSSSHVLDAMQTDQGTSAIRIGIGRHTTPDDVHFAATTLASAATELRENSPLWRLRSTELKW